MLLYRIALTMVQGIGDVLGRKLIAYCGDAEAVFREKKEMIRKIPSIGPTLSAALGDKTIFERAEKEIAFIQKYGIRAIFYTDKDYPKRLKNCIDSPLMLYLKGTCDLDARKVIGVVGTRNATSYGKELCQHLISGLKDHQPLIVSGLAYGIDGCAHRVSLEQGLETAGVLGHGLDRIYPYQHTSLAERMVRQGGIVADFPSGTVPDRENFPKRNRLIAGLCDGVVVVEAAQKGGALITAEIANSYNRDVFAFPGRIGDTYSEGTNMLIGSNRAALIRSAADLISMMRWEDKQMQVSRQRKIFLEMTPDEEKLVAFLESNGRTGIDEISLNTGLPINKVSAALLNLEFEGIVQSLPGKVYLLS